MSNVWLMLHKMISSCESHLARLYPISRSSGVDERFSGIRLGAVDYPSMHSSGYHLYTVFTQVAIIL